MLQGVQAANELLPPQRLARVNAAISAFTELGPDIKSDAATLLEGTRSSTELALWNARPLQFLK